MLKSILLVDDDELILGVVKLVLQKAGYNVLIAHNAYDALAMLRKYIHFDLAIVDIMMPGTSGTELIREIKAESEKYPKLKICILSSVSPAGDEKKLMDELGIKDYIQKPFDNKDLVKRVKEMIG